MMKISIVTICKNSAASITHTITSVIRQKTEIFEYIVVDGGSDDNTVDIVKSFGDAVGTFVSEKDDGIADAFNKGISMAKGDVIGLINSDDQLLPGSIAKVVQCFETFPNVEVVHGDILLYSGEQFVKRVKPAGRWWYPWRLVLFNHPATFVKKSVYEEYGLFSLDYKIAMDIDIFLRWVKKGVKIHYLEEPLVAMHYGGLSDRQPFQGYREAKTAFLANGFPASLVSMVFGLRPLVHRAGKLHAMILAWYNSK